MPKKITTEEFIKKAKSIHGEKYDYSKTKYTNNSTNICIICPEHGEFWQTPANHVHITHPRGCPKCNGGISLNTEEFVKKAKGIHGNKYDYSKVEYINSQTKVCIICPIHGEFWQTPSNHIHKTNHRGCPKCNGGVIMSMDEFLNKSNSIHGYKYIYDKVDLNNRDAKGRVCIICPEHGEFWQHPARHANGAKCKYCARVGKLTTEEFIERSNKKHGNKYNYEKTLYTIQSDFVTITCPIHGDFEQTANSHLAGAGCPHCHMSHLENSIQNFLDENKIRYKHIATKKDFGWLGKMSLDFYLPDYNVAIECQGIQHFKPVEYFENGKYGFEHVQACDKKKNFLCKKNGVKLLYYSDLGIEYPYHVFEDKIELLNEIKNGRILQN